MSDRPDASEDETEDGGESLRKSKALFEAPSNAAKQASLSVSASQSGASSAVGSTVGSVPGSTGASSEVGSRALGQAALRMVSDDPLSSDEDDLLGYTAYADAIAGLIDNPGTSTPLTLAINAPWGAGKSTLGGMVKRRLEGKPAAGGTRHHRTMWFNAWLHDDAEHLSAAFIAEVAQAADRHRPAWMYWLKPLPMSFSPPGEYARRVVLLTLGLVGVFVLVALGPALIADALWRSIADRGLVAEISEAAAGMGRLQVLLSALVPVTLAIARYLSTAAGAVADFVKDPARAAASGELEKVSSQLGTLIREATPGGSRFVIFIDDLDRCRPPTSIDVLESVNQLLRHPQVVVVVMSDIPALAAAAWIKYGALAEKYDVTGGAGAPGEVRGQAYGRHYLQKIVQLQFDLPPQGSIGLQRMLDALSDDGPPVVAETAGSHWMELGQVLGDPLLCAWRDRRSRRWLGGATESCPPLRSAALTCGWVLLAPLEWTGAVAVAFVADERARGAIRPPEGGGFLHGAAVLFGWLSVLSIGAVIAAVVAPLPFTGRLALALSSPLMLAARASVLWFAARARVRQGDEGLQRARDYLREHLDPANGDDPDAVAAAERAAALHSGLEPETVSLLRAEQQVLELGSDQALMSEALGEAFKFLPLLPRNVKRMLNRLRLLLYIAHARGILESGEDPSQINPRTLGKWAVLQERWPELALALQRRPSQTASLEESARMWAEPELDEEGRASAASAVHSGVAAIAPGLGDDPDLLLFFATGMELSRVMERLVRFEPA